MGCQWVRGRNINVGAGGAHSPVCELSGGGSEVWYIGNLSGIITLPAVSRRFRRSNWTLLRPGTGADVPRGTTAILLGFAICAIALLQQFAMNRCRRCS